MMYEEARPVRWWRDVLTCLLDSRVYGVKWENIVATILCLGCMIGIRLEPRTPKDGILKLF
jgi:hypothetical protein